MTLRKLFGSRLAHVPSADWNLGQLGASIVTPADAVSTLEAAASAVLGVECMAVGSARTAIWAALTTAQDISRVWVPAYTCVAVPNAVIAAGKEIRWVDVDGPNLDMSVVLSESRLGDAVLAQHTYGVPVDPDAIRAARHQGLYVVEDRAHRFDAADAIGDAVVFSLEHSKVVSGGQGGLLHLAGSDQIAAAEELLRTLPQDSGASVRRIVLTSIGQLVFDWHAPVADRLGAAIRRALLRLPAVSAEGQTVVELAGQGIVPRSLHPRLARLAERAIRRVHANLAHRERIAAIYRERLASLTPDWLPEGRPVVRYPVWAGNGDAVWRRVRAAGIDLGPRWFSSPVHPAGSRSSYVNGLAPRAEELSGAVLTLPTHMRVSEVEAVRIADEVTTAVRNAA